MKIVIVGGVAGGASAAARLRRLDEEAEIVLCERGEHISFANCGLPYYIGGEIQQRSALLLQTPQSFRTRFNVDVRVGSEVIAIDRAAKTVTVRAQGTEYTEPYDRLILAPGAEPIRPPFSYADPEGADLAGVFTLRAIPDADAIKARIAGLAEGAPAVVVGGGAIGLEMAENLVRAGLSVTVVERTAQVVAPLDGDMAAQVHAHLRMQGIRLLLGTAVERIDPEGEALRVRTDRGDLPAGLVVLAVGVRPESALAVRAGLACNARGAIAVDRTMRTSDPAIYAVGDAVEVTDFVSGEPGHVPLAGPANKQGRIAADNICGIPSEYSGTQGSAILRAFGLTIAFTGLNERAAHRQGIDCEKSFTFSANHATYYPGARDLCIKLVFARDTGRILGAQIVGGEGADKRCDVLATAIRLGATAADLERLELCYAPPYSSAKDPVNMAGFVIGNVLAGRIKLFHWHDVPAVQADPHAQLLDARTPAEHGRGHMEGAMHIPLDELRRRVGELDSSKKLYVYCHSGLRSYMACCILRAQGFDCYNLSGGYRLYAMVTADAADTR